MTEKRLMVQVYNLGVHPRVLEPADWIIPDENPAIVVSIRSSGHGGDYVVFDFVNSQGIRAIYFEIPHSQLMHILNELSKPQEKGEADGSKS